MKTIVLLTAIAAAVAIAAAPADAKKRRHPAVPYAAAALSDPYLVRDYDGEILGRDPDPFIRLMMRREGKIRDQVGR